MSLQTKGKKKIKSLIEEPLEIELKSLPNHLKYTSLEENDTLLVIISTHLKAEGEKVLMKMLKCHKKAIGWTLANIQGISPSYCMHKIRLKEGHADVIQYQRKLNHVMKEVVKKETIKWLDARVIYPIVNVK